MLGFSPLAAAPLADDGVVDSGVLTLTAQSIQTAAPSVGSGALAQEHSLTAQSIQTAAPEVPDTFGAESNSLTAQSIQTAAPSVPAATATVTVHFDAGAVALGVPTVGSPPFTEKHVLVAANINTLPVEVSGTNILVFVPLYTDDVLYGPPQMGNPYINPAVGREAVYGVSDGVSTATVRQSKNSAVVRETENLVEVVKSENAA